MLNQKHGLLSPESPLDSDSQDNALFAFSVAPAGRVNGMLFVPVSQLDAGTNAAPDASATGDGFNIVVSHPALTPSLVTPTAISAVAHNDAFGTTEVVAIGDGFNLFDDNGSGADSGSGFQVVSVNGNAGLVGQTFALASGALLTVNDDGTFFYDPNGAFDSLPGADSGASNHIAADTFTYTITGGSTATVTMSVAGIDTNDILIGTSGADHLNGGAGDDAITGGGGNDSIDGGTGDNTAVYAGALADYTVSIDTFGHTITVEDDRDFTSPSNAHAPSSLTPQTVAVSDGVDTLTNIQHLRFSDATESFVFDDSGQVMQTTIAHNGGLTITSQVDTTDASPWSGIVTTHDASGNLLSQVIDNDNGDQWSNEFGVGNSEPYLWSTEHRDADGNLESVLTTFTNGTHSLTLYDVANQYAWSDGTITFDANWNITGATGNADPPPPPPPPPPNPGDPLSSHPGTPLVAAGPLFTLADFQAALDTAVWFATPYDPNHGGPGDLTLTGGPANEVFYGFNGNDTINGGGGNDLIVGGRGDDVLTGGGGLDHFVFHAGDGMDTITDFSAGTGELIDLRGYDIGSFEQLQGMMQQTDTGVLLTFDPQDSLMLSNVDINSLSSGDFLLS